MSTTTLARPRTGAVRGNEAPWPRLAVIGDSLAEGVGDAVGEEDSWASLLATALGAEAYLNLGQRGLVASAIRSGQLYSVLRFDPDLAVVCAGGNDVLRRSFDPIALAIELEALVGSLAGQGALVVTFGLFDLSCSALLAPERRAELRRSLVCLNDVTRRVTAAHGGVHVDFFDDLEHDPSLLSDDQIHPNRRGHAHIAAAVFRAVALRGLRPVGLRRWAPSARRPSGR